MEGFHVPSPPTNIRLRGGSFASRKNLAEIVAGYGSPGFWLVTETRGELVAGMGGPDQTRRKKDLIDAVAEVEPVFEEVGQGRIAHRICTSEALPFDLPRQGYRGCCLDGRRQCARPTRESSWPYLGPRPRMADLG